LRPPSRVNLTGTQDTGVGVRKRVIKLLKSFYYITDDTSRLVDISTRMILRMLDEDDGVKELATRTMEELWFKDAPSVLTLTTKTSGSSTSRGNGVLAKVTVIMGVSANFKDRQSPFENLLRNIMANGEKAETSFLHARYAEICEVLIDGLVDASDLPGFVSIYTAINNLSTCNPPSDSH
jgi:cohesin loading factor subunit SCC2